MRKSDTTNTFNNGLVMDFNPLVTPNNVVTNALNATLITFNGNENVLQNDMGNGRVETAYLPEGYVPLGTTQLGGIIYIVSYNPLRGTCQIGSFPSPERNVTSDEVEGSGGSIECINFYKNYNYSESEESDEDQLNKYLISTTIQRLILYDSDLNPGDKFLIYSPDILTSGTNNSQLSAQYSENYNCDNYPKYLSLRVVCIQDNGTITDLTNTLNWKDNNYYLTSGEINSDEGTSVDLDEYRNLISSNYDVFQSKVSGKLGLLAKLECIDTFDCSWTAVKRDNTWKLYLLVNWSYDNESAPNKINLYGVAVKFSYTDNEGNSKQTVQCLQLKYPRYKDGNNEYTNTDVFERGTSSTQVTYMTDVYYYNPPYIENFDYNQDYDEYYEKYDYTEFRKNDDFDNQYIIATPFDLPDYEGPIEVTVYPAMPYGFIEGLAQTFTVDTSKLGTGEIDLVEYRYYYNSTYNSATINWGLEAYPEMNKNIDSVIFNFYKYDSDIKDWINNNDEYFDDYRIVKENGTITWESLKDDTNENTSQDNTESDTIICLSDLNLNPTTYTISSRTSYSGNDQFSMTSLESDSLYIIEIIVNYDNKEYIYYRCLYTSPIFNSYYYTETDYKNIVLEDTLNTYYPITYNMSVDNSTTVYDEYYLKKQDNSTDTYNDIDEIDRFLDITESTTCNYLIDNESQHQVILNNSVYSSISVLTATINKCNVKDDNSLSLSANNSVSSDSITNHSVYTVDSLDNIEYKFSGEGIIEADDSISSFIVSFNLTTSLPIIVRYSYQNEHTISYYFHPVTQASYFYIISGDRNRTNVYVSENLANGLLAGDVDAKDNQEKSWGSIADVGETKNCYNYIKNKLDSVDVVVLKIGLCPQKSVFEDNDEDKISSGDQETGQTSKNSVIFRIGTGASSGGDESRAFSGYNEIYSCPISEGANGTVFIYTYAIKDVNDTIRLFTYGTYRCERKDMIYDDNYQYSQTYTSIYNGLVGARLRKNYYDPDGTLISDNNVTSDNIDQFTLSNNYSYRAYTNYDSVIVLSQVVDNTILYPCGFSNYNWAKHIERIDPDVDFRMFDPYYKYTTANESKIYYDWSKIYYYPVHNTIITITETFNFDICLSANSTEIKPNLKINNLYYNNNSEQTLSASITKRCECESFIDDLTSSDTKVLVQRQEYASVSSLASINDRYLENVGEPYRASVSPKNIYDTYGNTIEYIKYYEKTDDSPEQFTPGFNQTLNNNFYDYRWIRNDESDNIYGNEAPGSRNDDGTMNEDYQPLKDAKNSAYKIKLDSDGKMYVTMGNSNSWVGGVIGRYEEQSTTLQNCIYMINSKQTTVSSDNNDGD